MENYPSRLRLANTRANTGRQVMPELQARRKSFWIKLAISVHAAIFGQPRPHPAKTFICSSVLHQQASCACGHLSRSRSTPLRYTYTSMTRPERENPQPSSRENEPSISRLRPEALLLCPQSNEAGPRSSSLSSSSSSFFFASHLVDDSTFPDSSSFATSS